MTIPPAYPVYFEILDTCGKVRGKVFFFSIFLAASGWERQSYFINGKNRN